MAERRSRVPDLGRPAVFEISPALIMSNKLTSVQTSSSLFLACIAAISKQGTVSLRNDPQMRHARLMQRLHCPRPTSCSVSISSFLFPASWKRTPPLPPLSPLFPASCHPCCINEQYKQSAVGWFAEQIDAMLQGSMNSQGADGRWTPQDGYRDILCDEDYEKFYRTALGAGHKLPAPLSQSTVYNQLPAHLLQNLTPQQAALAHQALTTPPPNGLLGTSSGTSQHLFPVLGPNCAPVDHCVQCTWRSPTASTHGLLWYLNQVLFHVQALLEDPC